ncbi:MAG: lysophospholipid acyltransferase family protein [Bacteroidota bacterium]
MMKHFLMRLLYRLANLLPRRLALRMADALGMALFFTVEHTRFRGSMQRTIATAFPGRYDQRDLNRLARGTAQATLRTAVELCRFGRLVREFPRFVEVQGLDHLAQAKAKGKGVILLSGHMGNWELFLASLPIMGYASYPIGLRQSDPVAQEILVRCREATGNRVYYTQDMSTADILPLLEANEIIVLLADHHHPAKRNILRFFGRPVSVPAGPVVLAQRSGAPVITGYGIRLPRGRHRIVIEPELVFDYTGDMNRDIRVNMGLYLRRVEEWVAKYPEQYFWAHERFAWLKPEEIAAYEATEIIERT